MGARTGDARSLVAQNVAEDAPPTAEKPPTNTAVTTGRPWARATPVPNEAKKPRVKPSRTTIVRSMCTSRRRSRMAAAALAATVRPNQGL